MYQQIVLNSNEQVSSQSLSGCMYHVVQGTGQQGNNILQLIPVSKSTDNLIPLSYAPVISNPSTVNVQKQITLSLPSSIPSAILPSPVNVLQQQQPPCFGNYIITTQRNPIEGTKSISVVDNKTTTPLKSATVILEKSHGNVALNPTQAPRQTFMMVNQTPAMGSVKTMPTLPSGHHLQIPANAEVKSVPASSLPLAIQQKILAAAQNSGKPDVAPNPSVIYVSPVNTVKTVANKNLAPAFAKHNTPSKEQAVQSTHTLQPLTEHSMSDKTASPKMPMKWIVQENKESASCLVPVKSSNDTASKILKLFSGTKNETNIANVLPASSNPVNPNVNILPIRDNALVMYNNKIYLLAKRGSEVFNTDLKNAEPSNAASEKPVEHTEIQVHSESMKEISNKVVEVVLSKNKVSKPNILQKSSSSQKPLKPIMSSSMKKQKCELVQPFKKRVDNGDDDVICISDTITKDHSASRKPHNRNLIGDSLKKANSIKPIAVTSIPQQQRMVSQDQLTKPAVSLNADEKPKVTKMSIKDMRLKFGLLKKEKVLLRRLPLLRVENKKSKVVSSSKNNVSINENETGESKDFNTKRRDQHSEIPVELQQHQIKRKSTSLDTVETPAKIQNIETSMLTMDSENPFTSKIQPSMSISLSVGSPKPPPITITCPTPSLSSTPPFARLGSSLLVDSCTSQANLVCAPPAVTNAPSPRTITPHPEPTRTFQPLLPDNSEVKPSSTVYTPNHPSNNSSGNSISVQPGSAPSLTSRAVSPSNSSVSSDTLSPADLDETVRDEKIRRLKELLREREEALEAIRRQMKN